MMLVTGVGLWRSPPSLSLSLGPLLAWGNRMVGKGQYLLLCLGTILMVFLFIAKESHDPIIWHLCGAFCLLQHILQQWYLLVWVTTQEDNDNDNESESCDFSPPGTKCLWVTACCELKNTDRQRMAADVVQTAAALWDFFTLQQLQTRPQNQNQNLMDFITFHLNMIIVAALTSTYVSNSPYKK